MTDDELFNGAPDIRPAACLLQRSYSLDTNALLAGSAPWELKNSVVEGFHPHAAPMDAHGHRSSYVPKFITALPHSVQIMITCGLLVIMLAFMLLGRSRITRVQGPGVKGAGICLHVLTVCISGFLRGYGVYIIGPLLTPIQRSLQLCFPCAGGDSDMALAACSCPWKEFAVSSVALGAIFGGLAGGSLADAVGRRLSLMISDVLFIVSCLMMSMSGPGAWSSIFFAGRVLLGLAVGVSGPPSHAYVSELVAPRHRGQLLILMELALIAGVFTVFVFSSVEGDVNWRRSIEFPVVPAFMQLMCTALFLHESPRWLAANGRTEDADRVIEALGLDESDPEHAKHKALSFDTKKMPSAAVADKRQKSGLAMLYHHRRRVAVAIGCALAHNALGANIVMYYSRDILQLASISNSVGNQIGLGAAKALGTGAAFMAVDRCGRRFLLILGVAGCIVGHLGLAVAFFPGSGEFAPGLAWGSLLLFLAAWDLGWASLFAVVVTEILPDDVRGLGLGASCSLYWLVSFVQAQTMETLFKRITISGTFAMYGLASILGLLFVLIYVPETCGRPLETE